MQSVPALLIRPRPRPRHRLVIRPRPSSSSSSFVRFSGGTGELPHLLASPFIPPLSHSKPPPSQTGQPDEGRGRADEQELSARRRRLLHEGEVAGHGDPDNRNNSRFACSA
jgi:hypothetical protein